MVRIVVADDHPLFREGVSQVLSAEPDIDVVGIGGSADDAVRLVGDLMPDVVLLDISMPGGGVEAARRIARDYPAVIIVMLTISEQDDDVIGALRAGARGYALKGVGASELVDIVKSVIRGESYVPPALAARILSEMKDAAKAAELDPFAELTAREEQILQGVARGLSNKEIANSHDLQEKTVKHYMTNILQKLHVRNRVEAAIMAQDRFPAK